MERQHGKSLIEEVVTSNRIRTTDLRIHQEKASVLALFTILVALNSFKTSFFWVDLIPTQSMWGLIGRINAVG